MGNKTMFTRLGLFLFPLCLCGVVSSQVKSTRMKVNVVEINPDHSSLSDQDADGASSGRINGLASADGSTVYAASEWGGLFKSVDAGHNWVRLDSHLPMATWRVKTDPTRSDLVYATSLYDGRTKSMAGISVSLDGGRTWAHPSSSIAPAGFCEDIRRDEPSAFGISVDTNNPQNVYIGTNCGLAISNDHGTTWHFSSPAQGEPARNIWDVVVHDRGIVDVCGDDGFSRSTNGGASWTPPGGLPSGRCSLAVSPDESYVLFAVIGESIYESDDSGTNWTSLGSSDVGRVPFVKTNKRPGHWFDLWLGNVGLYRDSCNTPENPAVGGSPRCSPQPWAGSYTRERGAHDDAGDFVFGGTQGPFECPLFFSSDGGVYLNKQSSDPDCQAPQWQEPETTPHALWLFGMDTAHSSGSGGQDLYLADQDNGTFASRNATSIKPDWLNPECCDSFDVSASRDLVVYTFCCYDPPNRPNILLIGKPGMTDSKEVGDYPPGNLPGWKSAPAIDQIDKLSYVVATDKGIFTTNNITGKKPIWHQLGSINADSTPCSVRVAFSANRVPVFYAQVGSCDGAHADQVFRHEGISGKRSWEQILPPLQGGFGIIAVDRAQSGRLLASNLTSGGPRMITSSDGGKSWHFVESLDRLMTRDGTFMYANRLGPTDFSTLDGYPQPTLVEFDSEDSNNVIAGGADSGLFLSFNGGRNWQSIEDLVGTQTDAPMMIPRPRLARFDHHGSGSFEIFVGTQGRGAWRIGVQPMHDVSAKTTENRTEE
jgi:hypothetical protein